ncbi:MAG: hypothetical protein K0U59_06445 [Gammaproteobacteria bacterium]|nr:hypothetical protein [Gammaproteobacteria bacterium]
MKRLLVAVVATTFIGCTSNIQKHIKHINTQDRIPQGSEIFLSYAGPENVAYQGMVNYNDLNVNGGAGMPYPGGTAGIFLASVLVHAAAVGAMKGSKQSVLEKQANQMLEPYLPVIQNIKAKNLITQAVHHIGGSSHNIKLTVLNRAPLKAKIGSWIMESMPVFTMLQDSSAIILQNSITLYKKSDKSPSIVYQNIIEVVSMPYQGVNTKDYWMKDEGKLFSTASHQLLADSIQLAVGDLLGSGKKDKEQTFRFYQEGKSAYERGSLVDLDHDRLIIRTLRGWIKSVPRYNDNNPYFKLDPTALAANSTVRGIGVYY